MSKATRILGTRMIRAITTGKNPVQQRLIS